MILGWNLIGAFIRHYLHFIEPSDFLSYWSQIQYNLFVFKTVDCSWPIYVSDLSDNVWQTNFLCESSCYSECEPFCILFKLCLLLVGRGSILYGNSDIQLHQRHIREWIYGSFPLSLHQYLHGFSVHDPCIRIYLLKTSSCTTCLLHYIIFPDDCNWNFNLYYNRRIFRHEI